jgi:phosphoglycolate phosphatase
MRFEAILFDLDGTLLDTLDDLADSMNAALRRLGYPEHAVAEYRYFVGDGVETLARRVLPEDRRDTDTVLSCSSAMREEYAKRWAEKSRPYDGVPDLLNALVECGMIMTVLSNKPHEFTEKVVATLLSGWRFDRVIGARPGVPKKPDPTAALEMAASLGIAPERFIYLGDTNTDMKTAVAAGMYPVGALWGFRTAEELTASGARLLIRRPMDALKAL